MDAVVLALTSVLTFYLVLFFQGGSDMTTLISMLCMQFGESPPVFAKPKNQPAQAIPQRSAAQPSAQPPGVTPGHTPYPICMNYYSVHRLCC